MKLVHQLRSKGIDCEMYPSSAKMQKQMKYANDRNVMYVALVGEEEMNKNIIQLKNMESGEQSAYSLEELIEKLRYSTSNI